MLVLVLGVVVVVVGDLFEHPLAHDFPVFFPSLFFCLILSDDARRFGLMSMLLVQGGQLLFVQLPSTYLALLVRHLPAPSQCHRLHYACCRLSLNRIIAVLVFS